MFTGRARMLVVGFIAAGALLLPGGARAQSAGANVRVTVDNGANGQYISADQLAGGSYTDAVLARCGIDRRMQNEPTLAIDPRNPTVWASGSNDYCTVPTAGDAWAGFYRSTDTGASWTDSLLSAESTLIHRPSSTGSSTLLPSIRMRHAPIVIESAPAGRSTRPMSGWPARGSMPTVPSTRMGR